MSDTFKLGDYNIRKFTIRSHNGFELDLKRYFTSIRIFEDILSSSITATVSFMDVEDMLTFMPIVGQEEVSLDFEVPEWKNIKLDFLVHKISELTDDEGTQTYNLELISKDFAKNFEEKVLEYFQGSSTDIAQTIFSRLGSSKSLSVESSSDQYSGDNGLVIPNYTPMKSISFLCNKAFSETYKSSSYMFFETTKEYVMKPLEMLTQAEPKNKFIVGAYKSAGAKELDDISTNVENKKVISFNFDSNFDVLGNITKGFYNSEVYAVDLLTRQVNNYTHSYWENYGDYKYLDSNTFQDTTGQGMQYKPKNLYVVPERDLQGGNPTFNQEKLFLPRLFYMQLMKNIKVTITVFGDTDVCAGDILELEMPIYQRDNTGTNKYYSGKYLVFAIRHRIEGGRYQTDIELVRDSIGLPLPAEQPTPPSGGSIQ